MKLIMVVEVVGGGIGYDDGSCLGKGIKVGSDVKFGGIEVWDVGRGVGAGVDRYFGG